MFFLFRFFIRVFSVLLVALLLYVVVTAVQVWMTSHDRSTAHADAIIVFGSAEYNGRPSPDLKDRLDQALALYRSGRAPIVAVTGGKQVGDRFTEAEVSAVYLVAEGVPAAQIVVGSGSDTYENVQSVEPPLKARGVKTLLVVTDPFHEDRAMAICSTFGFTPYPDPSQVTPLRGFGAFSYYLKETVAVAAGRLVGYGALSNASHPVS